MPCSLIVAFLIAVSACTHSRPQPLTHTLTYSLSLSLSFSLSLSLSHSLSLTHSHSLPPSVLSIAPAPCPSLCDASLQYADGWYWRSLAKPPRTGACGLASLLRCSSSLHCSSSLPIASCSHARRLLRRTCPSITRGISRLQLVKILQLKPSSNRWWPQQRSRMLRSSPCRCHTTRSPLVPRLAGRASARGSCRPCKDRSVWTGISH